VIGNPKATNEQVETPPDQVTARLDDLFVHFAEWESEADRLGYAGL
jgi:hypothetical protein